MALGSAALGLTTGSAAAFFAMGIFATAAAWALAGQVPALVKDIAAPGEAGRMLGLSLFPTAVGILFGAQLHGRLTESHTSLVFFMLAALLAIGSPGRRDALPALLASGTGWRRPFIGSLMKSPGPPAPSSHSGRAGWTLDQTSVPIL